ncbi:MAG: helix-turn-helix domain-containing protein [Chloroflexota bacterium]|nr:helix-turn-helix domain-containing protein [Chloroflexota bacterium]
MVLKIRPLTTEEDSTIERLIHARAMPAWKVTRAKIIWYAEQGQKVPEIAKRLELTEKTVRLWLKRFNDLGMKGLEESPRSGRPMLCPPEQIEVVVETK